MLEAFFADRLKCITLKEKKNVDFSVLILKKLKI